jgi:signal transduction histidine kinase
MRRSACEHCAASTSCRSRWWLCSRCCGASKGNCAATGPGTEIFGSPLDTLKQVAMSVVNFVPMLLLVTLAFNVTVRRSAAVRLALIAGAVLLGAALNAFSWQPLACLWNDGLAGLGMEPDCHPFHFNMGRFMTFARTGSWGALIAALLYFVWRERDATRTLHETHLQRLAAQRQESEARLRALQAQIEPHFLFNTLAHIQRLHRVDRRKGRSMLGSLIDYLQSALPQMRAPDATLERELALVRAYANVQQIRMGERLKVEFDVPTELHDARLPPMMVLTLAENAVKHGLGPKREGGTLRIAARRNRGRVEIVVSDDGVGLKLGSGGGLGLANTRARLATHYSTDAAFDIANNPSGGVSATLSVPFETAAQPVAP